MARLGSLRVLLACAFVAAGILGLGGAAQAAGCPSQSITVASGSTVVTDLSGCAVGIRGYQTVPSHGINDSRNVNPSSLVYYTNNGDGSTSDSFSVIDDDDGSIIPFTVTIASAGPSVTTPGLPGGTVGVVYSQTLAATGGTTPYSWSLASGALPAGDPLPKLGPPEAGVSGLLIRSRSLDRRKLEFPGFVTTAGRWHRRD